MGVSATFKAFKNYIALSFGWNFFWVQIKSVWIRIIENPEHENMSINKHSQWTDRTMKDYGWPSSFYLVLDAWLLLRVMYCTDYLLVTEHIGFYKTDHNMYFVTWERGNTIY